MHISSAGGFTLRGVHIQIYFQSIRLNFDYDMRRGLEEGPWIDGIPFDGRDIWQFTLVADDSKECMWRADPLSFVNLGPVHRPRCWPWSNDNALPYQRYAFSMMNFLCRFIQTIPTHLTNCHTLLSKNGH